jgi:hypothetical protein
MSVDMPDSQGGYVEKHWSLWLHTLYVHCFHICLNLQEFWGTVEGLVGKIKLQMCRIGSGGKSCITFWLSDP